MLDKIKKHRMLIAILTLLIVSNLFTIALFMSNQKDPTIRVSGDAPNETNIIEDSPGSSWNGNVTNINPVSTQTKIVKGKTTTITKVVEPEATFTSDSERQLNINKEAP